MATRQSSRSSASAESQARVEAAAQQAGIAAGFGDLAALGPQVLALQQHLLEGIVQSQRREVKRLAQLYGDNDSRIARSVERARQVSQLHAEAARQGEVVGRVAQTFQQDGLFHGYVYQSDGEPAAGYVVKLEMRGVNDKKSLQRGTAKTDAAGYFRLDLDSAGDDNPPEGDDVRRWTERLARMVADEVAPAPAEPAPEGTGDAAPKGGAPHILFASAPPAEPQVVSRVQVLDPSGRLVFEDPDPPTFEALGSEFRVYVLGEASGKRAGGTTGKKR